MSRDEEITRYVDGVRRALADLPPAVRDELIDDLAEHLAEVAAEGPGRLVDRLGPPSVYAAELRTAAGFGPSTAVPNLDDRIRVTRARIRARLHRLDVRVGAFIGYAKASDFLRLLRPGWWVLRGYLAAMLVTVAHADDYGLLPQFGNSVVAGLLLLAVTVAGSIWLGRRTSGFPRWRRLAVNAGSAVAAVFGLAMLLSFSTVYRYSEFAPVYNPDPYSNVQDVYVYDSEGRLVEGVRLFDQDGQLIRLGNPWWCGEDESWDPAAEPARQTYPYCPEHAPFHLVSPSPSPSHSSRSEHGSRTER
jgi:hypothetical protein